MFDPMCGSGTTGKMALLNNRQFIGVDISQDYIDIAKERIGLILILANLNKCGRYDLFAFAPRTPKAYSLPLSEPMTVCL